MESLPSVQVHSEICVHVHMPWSLAHPYVDNVHSEVCAYAMETGPHSEVCAYVHGVRPSPIYKATVKSAHMPWRPALPYIQGHSEVCAYAHGVRSSPIYKATVKSVHMSMESGPPLYTRPQ